MNITVNERTLNSIYNDANSNEDLIAFLNSVIDEELLKEEPDCNLIDDCVNTILELENSDDFIPFIRLAVTSDSVKKMVNPARTSWKSLNRALRVAIVAAIIATSTFTVNAAVKIMTNVDIIGQITDTIIDYFNKDDGKLNAVVYVPSKQHTTKPITTHIKETTTKHKKPHQSTTQPIIETTTVIEEATTEKQPIWQDSTTTTQLETTSPKATTNKEEQATNPFVTPNSKVEFTGIKAKYKNFKTAYVYGENITYDGLTIYAQYSDGSEEIVPLSQCSYTKNLDMNKTTDYTLTVIYKDCALKINITVRPDENTRISDVCSNEDWEYLSTKKGAYITAYKGSGSSISINQVDGISVYAITTKVFENSGITEFRSNTVECIYPSAFKGCKDLALCDIPNAISIGEAAFDECTNLSVLSFSNSIKELGNRAFANTAIRSVSIPSAIDSVPRELCEGCTALENVELNGQAVIGDSAFSSCISLTNVSGTKGIKRVENFGFYEDEKMNFDYPLDSLESAGKYAFSKCRVLDTGSLPRIKAFDEGSFEYCTLLKSVEIPKSVTVIPFACFMGTRLESIELHNNIKRIESYAFMSTMIKTVDIPEGVEYVGTRAFFTTRLRDVYVHNKTVDIDDTAFYAGSRTKLYVIKDSTAQQYAIDNDIDYSIIDK